ncbi:nuclear transport factor 2 family protein [Ginsengibacter hankyongi]|uniref:Nuclear transport factor 2 family protein n=2 Tax=Ginsengibacter hankyongi TaxID=2607284 RepID=A0A5J5IFT0_9BACT|nr:nuclear transport factor 2 family protein [Ginsengibacter hankyongi]
MKEANINTIINQFIKSLNAFDVEATLTLFADNAVIDDVSVGEKFKNTTGVRDYLEKFFVNYKTMTKLASVEAINDLNANAQVDFTGDFGHETGSLNFTLNTGGLITAIGADLD